LDFKRRGRLPIHQSHANKTYSEKFQGMAKFDEQSSQERHPQRKVSEKMKDFSSLKFGELRLAQPRN
jgi:hypothetical protein